MKNIVCPYCKNNLEGNETVCPKCNNSLTVQCPYCKEPIPAYEEVCPRCTSRLKKPDYLKYTNYFGMVISAIWAILSLIGILLFIKYPQIFDVKDKDGDSALVMSKYIECCVRYGVLVSVPYIITIIKKYKIHISIIAISINLILMAFFTTAAIFLKFTH